jgi:hypothetical protein
VNKEELIAAASAKFKREQLIEAAKAKWASENGPVSEPDADAGFLARSAAEGATFGISEPVISGVKALGKSAIEAVSKEDVELTPELIKSAYAKDIEMRRSEKAANPKADIAAQIAGGVASSWVPGIGQANLAVGIPGRVAANALKLKAGGLAARMVGSAGAAATGQAIENVVEENTGFRSAEESPSALTAAGFGAGLTGAGSALAGSWKAAKQVGQAFLGAHPEAIDRYLANPKAINEAKGVDEVYDTIKQGMAKSDNELAQESDALASVKESLANKKMRQGDELAAKKELLSNIQQNESSIVRPSIEANKAEKIQAAKLEANVAKDNLGVRVANTLDGLADTVSKRSSEAFGILEKEGALIDTKKLSGVIQEIEDDIQPFGFNKKLDEAGNVVIKDGKEVLEKVPTLVGKARNAAAETLADLRKVLTSTDYLPISQIKAQIMDIDSMLTDYYRKAPGAINDQSAKILKKAREGLDEALKSASPEYKAFMASKVQPIAKLRADALAKFGESAKNVSVLQKVLSGKDKEARAILRRVGAEFGMDFEKEYAAIDALAKQAEAAAKTGSKAAIDRINKKQGLAKSKLAQEIKLATRNLEAEKLSAIAQQENKIQQLRDARKATGLASEAGIEPWIKQWLTTPKLVADDQAKAIAMMINQTPDEFIEGLLNMRTKASFERRFQNGSANVNLWTDIGSFLQNKLGAGGVGAGLLMGGAEGAVLGGMFGKIVDMHGPKMVKKTLDVYLKVMRNPTIKTLEKAMPQLPPDIAQRLKRDFVRTFAEGLAEAQKPIQIDASHAPWMTSAIKDTSMSNIEKAKAMNMVNKGGAMPAGLYSRIVLDGYDPTDEELINDQLGGIDE